MPCHKLLVVGLDGATFDLVKPWAADDTLPLFAKLLANGAHGSLRSVPNTEPTWATFASGLDPARHGIFHEVGWSMERRILYPLRGSDLHGQPFWRIASQAGRRILIVNVRFTYPAEPVNGILVAGADAPGVNAARFCYPSYFIAQARHAAGKYRISGRIQAAIKAGYTEDGLADVYSVEKTRTETFCYAMMKGNWELAVIVYDLPDAVQHFFWQQMVTGVSVQRHAIRDAYMFIERQIERLLACAGQDTNLLLLSDHGFGPICATAEHLANWLSRQGFMQILDGPQQSRRRQFASRIYAELRHRLAENQKAVLRRALPNLCGQAEFRARFANIDWLKTKAYVGLSPFEIWINCQGREPQGIVAPGADYERVCRELIVALLNWHDPQTGQRRVRGAYRREEVYHGSYLDRAPDVTIEWNPEAAPPADEMEGNGSLFDGDHQPDGLLLASGPDIRARVELGASLTDLAPTILHLLNVSPSVALDGRVLIELLNEEKAQEIVQ